MLRRRIRALFVPPPSRRQILTQVSVVGFTLFIGLSPYYGWGPDIGPVWWASRTTDRGLETVGRRALFPLSGAKVSVFCLDKQAWDETEDEPRLMLTYRAPWYSLEAKWQELEFKSRARLSNATRWYEARSFPFGGSIQLDVKDAHLLESDTLIIENAYRSRVATSVIGLPSDPNAVRRLPCLPRAGHYEEGI